MKSAAVFLPPFGRSDAAAAVGSFSTHSISVSPSASSFFLGFFVSLSLVSLSLRRFFSALGLIDRDGPSSSSAAKDTMAFDFFFFLSAGKGRRSMIGFNNCARVNTNLSCRHHPCLFSFRPFPLVIRRSDGMTTDPQEHHHLRPSLCWRLEVMMARL